MPEKPPKEAPDEPGAEDRFKRGIENALKMPAKPHSSSTSKRDGGKHGERQNKGD